MSANLRFSLTLAIALLGAATTASVCAQPKPTVAAQLLLAGSEIVFTTKQMSVPVEGRFGKFSANIQLDPKRPETGNVSFSIDTGSARFGSAETDREVPKPEWLNTAKFPQATFQSTVIKGTGAGKFEVAGKLSIKGGTRDVVVPVQLTPGAGAATTATGSFAIKRLEFKIGEGDWTDTSIVANDVQVRFKLQIKDLGAL